MSRRAMSRLGLVLAASALGASVLPAMQAQAAVRFRAADTGARITSYKWLNRAKTAFDFTVRSPSLGTSQNVRVLVPKGWRFGKSRSYPVVYALHGGRDTWRSWTRSTKIASIAARYNVMVVMPEGANGSYTDWWNYGKGGKPKWETFHLREVRQLVERNYQAGGSRAIMGISSGAQGACTYPGRAPGMFRYAACFSGTLSLSYPGIPALLMYTNMGNGADPFAIYGIPRVDQANWDAHDPIKLLPRMKSTTFYISAGTQGIRGPLDNPKWAPWHIGYLSEPPIGLTTMAFRDRARQLGVRMTAHIYSEGSHSWPYWRREMDFAWPSMMSTIGARRL